MIVCPLYFVPDLGEHAHDLDVDLNSPLAVPTPIN